MQVLYRNMSLAEDKAFGKHQRIPPWKWSLPDPNVRNRCLNQVQEDTAGQGKDMQRKWAWICQWLFPLLYSQENFEGLWENRTLSVTESRIVRSLCFQIWNCYSLGVIWAFLVHKTFCLLVFVFVSDKPGFSIYISSLSSPLPLSVSLSLYCYMCAPGCTGRSTCVMVYL